MVMVDLRTEYPRPQFVRPEWLCLNGTWEFEIDRSESGEERRFYERPFLDGTITVPYCPESVLSGVHDTDFMNCVWYRKVLTLPDSFLGKRVLLHIGAVDYYAKLWVNGRYVSEHKGGYVPFDVDITDFLTDGETVLTVCAYDHLRDHRQPSGKQSSKHSSYGCYYTRTTGIWQSIWLEPVSEARIHSFKAYPDCSAPAVDLQFQLTEQALGCRVSVRALYGGRPVGEGETVVASRAAQVHIPLRETHLWEAGKGDLYDLEFILSRDGAVQDSVVAYFGLRQVGLDRKGMTLNGRHIFGRWVLDQGFYPDGIYTAPSDQALKEDILNSMKLGFNGARLHEKVFEPRFLYWADRLGYLVWGEHANWGLDVSRPDAIGNFLPEWLAAMERDFSHSSIIGWCPLNETWDTEGRPQCDEVLRLTYLATKAADPTRPVIDTSGNFHVQTDIFDVHDYEQDPEKFASYYARVSEGIVNDQCERNPKTANRQKYDRSLPVFMSEYGGIKWSPDSENGWGYGNSVTTEEEFFARYQGLTDALLDHPDIMGFCYTQLYDVEQEQNGLMTYDRKFKFDPARFYSINTRKAAIED